MKSGFTLIELLISVAIGGVLLGAAIASFRGLGTKQQVKQAGIGFTSDLKSFQQKAAAGQKPDQCSGTDTLTGYRVRYVDTNTYSVKAVCQINNPTATNVDLPNEVVFSASFNPVQIVFPVLGGQVTGAQTIILEKDTYRYQVMIETFGVIRGEML